MIDVNVQFCGIILTLCDLSTQARNCKHQSTCGHKVSLGLGLMIELVYLLWPEVKGQNSKRAEVRMGDYSKLTT